MLPDTSLPDFVLAGGVSAGGPVRTHKDAQILHRHLKARRVAGRKRPQLQLRPNGLIR
jgi:hypothetical protein